MGRVHIITERIENPAVFDEKTGEMLEPASVHFEKTEIPFTAEEEAACDAAEAESKAIQEAEAAKIAPLLALTGMSLDELKAALKG